MNTTDLNYLSELRLFFSQLMQSQGDDPGLTAKAGVYGQLVDHMIVEHTSLGQQAKRSIGSIVELLTDVEKELPELLAASGSNDFLAELVAELGHKCNEADVAEFDHCLELLLKLQTELVNLNSDLTNHHVDKILQIEKDYNQATLDLYEKQSRVALDKSTNAEGTEVWNNWSYDPDKLEKFVIQSFPDEKNLKIKNTSFISGGYSKLTMSIGLSDTDEIPSNLILRADANATYGGASVIQEYELLDTLFKQEVNVPRPLVLEESGNVFGTPFFLMEKKPGQLIGHMFNLPGKNPDLNEEIAKFLATIHQVPLEVLGDNVSNVAGINSSKVTEWLEEGYKAWQSLGLSSPTFEAAFAWLFDNAAMNDNASRSLVHGDFGLNNILIDAGRVSCILDWEFAHIGNPAYDLGYFYFMAQDLGSWEEFLVAYNNAGCVLPDDEQLYYSILFGATRLGVMATQARTSFVTGAQNGLSVAAVHSGHFYERSIKRVSFALEQAREISL